MRIAYVLPHPELNGGNKVVGLHAGLLRRNGDDVLVLGEGPRPGWFPRDVEYRDLTRPFSLPSQDLVIATFWTTIAAASRLELGPLAHFCQGYEGDLPHMAERLPDIEAAYSTPVPLFAVTPFLAERIGRRFGRPSRVVSPSIDRRFRPRVRIGPRRRPWILVPGIYESTIKGVETALRAVHELRESGVQARVGRVSILPLSDAERAILEPDQYHLSIAPEDVARHFRAADLLILPSLAAEGFGLPLLEAMASGLPAVASRIPSTEWMAGDVVALVEPGNASAFAGEARALLGNRGTWRQARRAGLVAAERFAPERIADDLAAAVRWAAERPAIADRVSTAVPALV